MSVLPSGPDRPETSAAPLPAHLADLARVYADESARHEPLTPRILSRLPGLAPVWLAQGERPPEDPGPGQTLWLRRYQGRFLRPCPGTRAYHCCGYRIAHIGENCPMSCTYCILQAYFQDRTLKVWANRDDFFRELEETFSAGPDRRVRIGTGEFTDSLALEALTGLSGDLVEFLGRFPKVCLELKSKTVDLSWMDRVPRPDRVLPAWSLNAPQVVDTQERGTASLEARLAAARDCARAGFRVCLHFDPIIRFPGWQEGYGRTAEMVRDHLRPEDVAYISLGSFRHMPGLEGIIARRHPQAGYIHGEFVPGLDGKMRLLRPLRVEQFAFLAGRLRQYGFDKALYFCMESGPVWRAVLGREPGDFGGLAASLLDRAFGTEG